MVDEVTVATHWVEKWIALVKAHERLLIVLLVLTFGWRAYGAFLNYEAARKDAVVTSLQQTVDKDKQTVQDLTIKASQAASDYQAALDSATKTNASLRASLAQESALLASNRHKDDQSNMPELAARLVQLTPGTTVQSVTADSTGLSLDIAASHAVVSQLESVPILQNQVDGQEKALTADQHALDDASGALRAADGQIAAMKTEAADSDKVCKAQIAAEKVKTKKAWRSGFKWGFGIGFAAGAYVMHLF